MFTGQRIGQGKNSRGRWVWSRERVENRRFPLIYAETPVPTPWRSRQHDSGKNPPIALVYDTYDVQTPRTGATCDSPPFRSRHPYRKNYARGATDGTKAKKPPTQRGSAVSKWFGCGRTLPMQIKFLIRRVRRRAARTWKKHLPRLADLLACDGSSSSSDSRPVRPGSTGDHAAGCEQRGRMNCSSTDRVMMPTAARSAAPPDGNPARSRCQIALQHESTPDGTIAVEGFYR